LRTALPIDEYRSGRECRIQPLGPAAHAGRPLGGPSEIGPAAVFPASNEASFVSGLVMTVDGAFTAAM
jgi:NAD(P)-dependent dehydrogenase (short-subunit alcohol dehydrogenase family)